MGAGRSGSAHARSVLVPATIRLRPSGCSTRENVVQSSSALLFGTLAGRWECLSGVLARACLDEAAPLLFFLSMV